MAGLVLGGICRYTLNQTCMGHNIANIVDMHIDSGILDGGRDNHILDQAHILARQWKADIMDNLSDTLFLNSVSWVDLDTEGGATGEFNGDTDVPLPAHGSAGGNPMPCNVALLVKKSTTSGRGAHSGRMYVAGMVEEGTSQEDPNHITASFRSSFQSSFDDWLGNIEQDGTIGEDSYHSFLQVVHQPAGGTPSSTRVSALAVDSLLATQRRRLRG